MFLKRIILFSILCSLVTQVWSAATLKNIRMAVQDSQVRLVLDLDTNINTRVFSLDKPNRLVIDLENTKLSNSYRHNQSGNKFINKIRLGGEDENNLRVVIDLTKKGQFKYFIIPGSRIQNTRMVVDINFDQSLTHAPISAVNSAPYRDIKIVIDPGHGGKDPGAIGPNGTWESLVVLGVSRQLANQINKTSDMRGFLTRSDDSFVPLRDRMEIAREQKADLFVSIHADALDNNSRVKGASIYILSDKGANDEASKRLAKRENENLGDISLSNKNDSLASVLMDLSQGVSIETSREVGKFILNELARVGSVRKKKVQQGNFLVLKSPDVPSILIETTYISNPSEEKKLKDKNFQSKLAKAILQGIRNYYLVNPLEGTKFANNLKNGANIINYIVQRGDTLSEIAETYDVKITSLRSYNKIKGSTIKVGQTLRIPLYR